MLDGSCTVNLQTLFFIMSYLITVHEVGEQGADGGSDFNQIAL